LSLSADWWRAFLRALRDSEGEERLLARLAELVRQAMDSDACEIFLDGADGRLTLRASTAEPDWIGRVRLAPGVGLIGAARSEGQIIRVPNAMAEHPRFAPFPGVNEGGYESGIYGPLPRESPFGAVRVRRRAPWAIRADEIRRFGALMEATGDALLAYRAVSRAQTERLAAVSEVTRTIAGSPYLEEMLQFLVNVVAERFGYKVVSVRLLDAEHQELVLRATQSPVKAYRSKPAIRLGESFAGRAIETLQPVTVADVLSEPEYIGHDLAAEQGLRSMVCVPLLVRDRALGVLTCYTSEVRDFPADEVAALETLARQAAVSIEHAKLQVRDTLMQEMHHRVKNNLQQVASLLRLQLRHHHYRSIEDAINDSLSRILAIAAVHELLSREDLDHVGIRTIAESLVQTHQQSLLSPGKSIAFQVRGDDLRLNMMQATQVALVLNELIQNAIEHGFRSATEGNIHVTVEILPVGVVGLWVSNDGDRLPEGFEISTSAHLGLQIVQNLARALGGSFRLEDRLGWAVAEVLFRPSGPE
jgi:two-component sensor histidine kinase